MYLVLLAAAAVAGCVLRFLDAGVAAFNPTLGIGETLGRVGALFLFAALVPTVMVLLSRRPIASARTPTAVGLVVLAALAYSSYRALEFERTFAWSTLSPAADQLFSPPGCGFAAVFPSQPKITSLTLSGFGEFPEAEIDDDRGLMRANCISVSNSGSIIFYRDPEFLMQALQAYVQQNGIGNITYRHDIIDLGVRASARGTKQLDGRWVTYETVWFVSPQSVMSLTVGHISQSYPTQEISRFLDSVSRSAKTTSNESIQDRRLTTAVG
jgi:hypothetical protein